MLVNRIHINFQIPPNPSRNVALSYVNMRAILHFLNIFHQTYITGI